MAILSDPAPSISISISGLDKFLRIFWKYKKSLQTDSHTILFIVCTVYWFLNAICFTILLHPVLPLPEHLHDGGGHAHDLQVLVGPLQQAVLGHGQLLTDGRLLAFCEAAVGHHVIMKLVDELMS